MKLFTQIILFGILALMVSCTNNESSVIKQPDNAGIVSDTIYDDSASQEDNQEAKTNPLIWKYDSMEDTIRKVRIVSIDTLSTGNLMAMLNSAYIDKVILDYVKVSSDTIFVKIKDSKFLTQQMGSAGSMDYMITTTFTLTELKDINYVHFSFDYGDHASPGTYSRKYYLDMIASNRKTNNK